MNSDNISTKSDFRDYVLNALFEDVNLSPGPTDGAGIHIGIIDSVHIPPLWMRQAFDVYSTRSFVNADSDEFDLEHGMEIFDIISRIVPHAKFSFYQAIGTKEHTGVAEYTKAVNQAVDDGVDLLNLSLGAPNAIPPKASGYYPPIQNAIENNVIPVAAAGNLEYNDGPKQYVYGPANIPEVIAVAGCETLCPQSPPSEVMTQQEGPYFFETDPKDRIFCSHTRCSDGTPCVRNNATRPWSDNTKPLDGKPDIFAPSHFPTNPNSHSIRDVGLKTGSSYAAPIVTGTIAKVLTETGTSVREVVHSIRDLVIESGNSVDDVDTPKLDAFNLLKRLEKAPISD